MEELSSSYKPKSATPQRKGSEMKGLSDMTAKLQNKFELKSSIPKPMPFGRRSSSATPLSRSQHSHQNCFSSNYNSVNRGRKSCSISLGGPPTRDNSLMRKAKRPAFSSEKLLQTIPRSLPSNMANRPKSAGILRTATQMSNRYVNVKAKINSNLVRPVAPNIVRPMSPNLIRPMSANLARPKSPNLQRELSPRQVSPMQLSPRRLSPRQVSPMQLSPRQLSPRQVSPRQVSPRQLSPRQVSPRQLSPRQLSPMQLSPRQLSPTQLSPRQVSPRELSPTNMSAAYKSNKTSISAGSKTSISMKSDGSYHPVEGRQLSEEDIVEKQIQLFNIYNELKELQPAAEPQALPIPVCPNVLAKPKSPSKEKSFSFAKDSPEFLSKFEKQMEEVMESWLRFICDIISHKLMIGNSSLSRITLPDPFQDPHREVYKFLAQMPTEGDNLQLKLQSIEQELLKVMTVVMHNVTALWKDHEDLKDRHWRLEKTQDQLHMELQEELAILSEENKALDKKYVTAVDKYNQEKAKYEAQEKSKLLVNRDAAEMKKKIKCLEGKCTEWQFNIKKFEGECKAIESSVRNTNLSLDKEAKQHRELFCRYNEAQDNIRELNSEIIKRNEAYMSLEAVTNKLQQDVNIMKASLEESLKKRNELTEDLADKTKKMNEAESELNKIRAYVSNSSPSIQNTANDTSSALFNDIQQRDVENEVLTKKLKYMENAFDEISKREEMLMKQVQNLQIGYSFENEVALKAQITNLQYEVKDLTDEKAELEKMVVQKSLELDQRDLMMKQNSQIRLARDELIPIIQSKHKNQKECTERLRAVVLDHQKTYFNLADDGFYNNESNMALDDMQTFNQYFIHDPSLVEQKLSFHKEKMTEVYSLLEQKQMEMMRLERRLQELQRLNEEKEKEKEEREDRLLAVQKELSEAKEQKASRSRGFFSLFTTTDYSSG